MKQKIIILAFLIFSANVFATEQTSDLLIIEKDTIFLKIFPLEQLELKLRPFSEIALARYVSNCYRGYKATWKIVDNKLFLEKIVRCNREIGEENIIELFERNNIQYQEKNGMIFADWCTLDLYRMTTSSRGTKLRKKDGLFLYDRPLRRKNKRKIILQIENGIITINKLAQLERPSSN